MGEVWLALTLTDLTRWSGDGYHGIAERRQGDM